MHVECASMIQCAWHGIDGTAGLGYWTHNPDGSLPFAQLERPISWASPRRATSIHTYIFRTAIISRLWLRFEPKSLNLCFRLVTDVLNSVVKTIKKGKINLWRLPQRRRLSHSLEFSSSSFKCQMFLGTSSHSQVSAMHRACSRVQWSMISKQVWTCT